MLKLEKSSRGREDNFAYKFGGDHAPRRYGVMEEMNIYILKGIMNIFREKVQNKGMETRETMGNYSRGRICDDSSNK